MKKILVSVPTYNESENIKQLCQRIFKIKKNLNLIIIDDNSPDGTADKINKLKKKYKKLILIKRKRKLGIGSAIRRAMNYALKNNYDVLITLDADLSHQPEKIPSFLKYIKLNDFVIGSRYIKGGKSDYTGYRNFVSKFANKICRLLLNIHLNEFTTSFRAYNKKCLRILNEIPLYSDGYSSLVEFIFYIDRAGLKYIEVPIHFKDRFKGKSKIPKLQIIYGGLKLIELFIKRSIIPKKKIIKNEKSN